MIPKPQDLYRVSRSRTIAISRKFVKVQSYMDAGKQEDVTDTVDKW